MKLHPGPVGFFIRHYGFAAFFGLLVLVGGPVAFFNGLDGGIPAGIFVLGALIWLVGVVHALLHDQFTTLYLSEEELIFETGILHHRIRRVPISKITDTSTDRDFLDKLLGACTLEVNTAGSSGYEVEARGFKFAAVQAFLDELYGLIHEMPESLPSKNAMPRQR